MIPVVRVISGILSVYMLLLFIRILLTWFSGVSLGKPQEILQKVTDPYLSIFRRLSFLHTSRIDFSPIAALIVLVIILNILNTITIYGQITVGVVLALIVSALWSAAFFILGFFIILVAVRFLFLFFGNTSFTPFWQTIDLIVNPILAFMQRRVFRGKQLTYRTGLGFGLAILIATAVLGRVIINQLVRLLRSIPF